MDVGAAPTGVSRPWLERVLDVVRTLGAADDLADMLNRVAESVVTVLDFGATAINVTGPDGHLRVEAVAGPPGLVDMLGQRTGVAEWEGLLAAGEQWGSLVFFSHAADQALWDGVASWSPPVDAPPEPGAWHPDDSLFAPMRDSSGALVGVISVDQPSSGRAPDLEQRTVLELFAAQAAAALVDATRRGRLSDSELLYRTVFAGAPAPILIVGDDLVVVAANSALAEIVDRTRTAVLHSSLVDLVSPADQERVAQVCRRVLAEPGSSDEVEHGLLSADGTVLRARTRVGRVDSALSGTSLVLHVEDVTEDRRTMDELRHRAEHDGLTGLPNRRSALLGLTDALRHRDLEREVVVLGCDLDGFKQVNDSLGHLVGDQLLVQVAARLRDAVRPDDLLCRQGGDEFLVVAQVQRREDATVIAQRCVDALVEPFLVGELACRVSLSVGVAVAGLGEARDEVLERADVALYRAKALGRSRWHLAD